MSGGPSPPGAGEVAPVKVRKKPGPKPGSRSVDKPRKKPGPKPGSRRVDKPRLKPGPKPGSKRNANKAGKSLKTAAGKVVKRAGAGPTTALPKAATRSEASAAADGPTAAAPESPYPQEPVGRHAHAIADRPLTNQRVEHLVVFTLAVNTYVHTIQAERGASTAYVSGQGNVLGALLNELRGEVDDALRRLKETRLYPDVAEEFDKSKVIAAFRRKVDFLQMTYLEVMSAFNMLIEGLIESICRVVVPLHQINVGMPVGTYVTFMFLKDKVGVERATVGGVLSDPRGTCLEESTHLALVANLGSMKALVKAFVCSGISDEMRQRYIELHMFIPPEIGNLERELVTSRESSVKVLRSMTTEEWFKMMTARMNELDKIQQELASDIRDAALKYVKPTETSAAGQAVHAADNTDVDNVFEVLSRIESEDLMLPIDWTVRLGVTPVDSPKLGPLPTHTGGNVLSQSLFGIPPTSRPL
mmetsp:Transcript_17894/g.46621  ORF Transcript_17894/g.46621 Transcript_17894/m.46621 type:complete len:473 (-) Transcript_17894:153-1571(-)